uniref:Uncharacterized protein n=1 Tax=Dulem virus 124 TaxID=3145601 RepID=A0AAU8B5A0_9VIRU
MSYHVKDWLRLLRITFEVVSNFFVQESVRRKEEEQKNKFKEDNE